MESTKKFRILLTGLIFAVAGCVIGCSSGSSGAPQPTPTPIGVSLAPNGAQTVDQGQAKQFTATVANDSANKGVKWTLTQNGSDCSPGCGTISPATTPSGTATTYTAPAAVNTNVPFNVTATSVADTSKAASDQGTAVPSPALNNPAQLPAASPGQPYKYQLTETGGVPPYTWSVVSGSLPQGLTLNSGTGVISGTPTAAASVKKAASVRAAAGLLQDCFTVQVADSGNPPVMNTEQVCISVGAVPTVAACGANPPAGAPTIGTQPTRQSFTLSSTPQTANFSVSATSGDATALQYQWFVGAFGPPAPVLSPIPGATTAGYTTPTLTGAFNNLQYLVQVSNDVCFVNSTAAVLTVTENPNGMEIQIPTEEQGLKNIVLTRSGGAQYMACQSSTAVTENSCPGGAQVDWSLALNGLPCSPQCGSVVPQSAPAGTRVTYVVPPGGLDLAGEYLTIVATNDSDSTEFASAPIHVTPCNPGNVGVPGDPMCGEFTFLIQGFDANQNPTSAAGHFSGTGLLNGTTTITDGVMDFNDANGVDAGVAITSGSYTFDRDSNGNLLTDTSAATGTITLNTSSTTPSHQQRNYAFTGYAAGAVSGPTQAWPLIEFEPSQTIIPPATSPAANPANGFQGSGTMWPVSAPGPYAFPNSNCSAVTPPTKPPFDCNYAFQFRGNFSTDSVGIVGVFNASFGANNNCVLSSGAQDMITNAAGKVLSGAMSGGCGTLTTVNGVGVADDANGRGSANMTIQGVSTPFEYYVVPRGPIVFIRMDAKAAGDTLSGVAKVTGLGGSSQFSTLECGGSIIINGQEPHCVMYSTGEQGGSATLTVGQLACGSPFDHQPGNVVCKESVANGQLTGVLSATLDQVAFGNLNSPALTPCSPATTGNPTPPVCPYSINTTNGEGFICLDPNNTPPPNTTGCPGGITDPHAVVYADGFLLANDSSVATGSLNQQLFFCATPCSPGPVPFDNNLPTQFTGSTVPSSTSTAPDATGSFVLGALANSCPGKTDNFDSDTLFASGLAPSPFILTIPPAPKISGCFAFDNPADPVITGRGTGNSTVPGPANFVFYEVNPEEVIVMQTDNTNNGGQVLLNLLIQDGPNSFISPSTANFSVGMLGSFTVVATEAPANPTGPNVHLPSLTPPATLADGKTPLPAFLQFTVNGNGTITLSGTPAKSDINAYPMLITADYTPTQNQKGCASGDFCVTQVFVLTVQ